MILFFLTEDFKMCSTQYRLPVTRKRQIQIWSSYMLRQTANYCFIGTQIFNTFPNRKYHKLQLYDNILWIEYNENGTCIHKAIIINYFAMETQFNHLLAFHSFCGLVHFKMVHYLNIMNSFYKIVWRGWTSIFNLFHVNWGVYNGISKTSLFCSFSIV